MKPEMLSALRKISRQQWSALGLSLGLGGLLVAVLFAVLSPRGAAAVEAAAPAASYACSEAGLNAALGAGGSATFSCGVPTTVTLSSRKNVPHNLTLDGTNTLILQGSSMVGVFTVPAGIQLSLLNLTLRDAGPGAILNSGVLNVSHGHFISDTSYAVWNLAGSAATLSDSTVEGGFTKLAALTNGGFAITETAALTVVNSSLHNNLAGRGAAILNNAGLVTVIGSNFYNNVSFQGGAIWNESQLAVSTSQFTSNVASAFILFSQAQGPTSQADLASPSGLSVSTGGAIFSARDANLIVSSSDFTDNFSTHGGGAIMFGDLPLGGLITPTGASLTIAGSTFVENCTGGPGGAVAASQKTTVSGSSFSFNFGDASAFPCVTWSTNHPNSADFHAPDLANSPAFTVPANLAGSGGALFSSADLAVDGTSFLTNTATVSPTGGGGAIVNFAGGILRVTRGTFQDNFARYDGGAIYNDVVALANLIQSSFTGNRAQLDSGGAVANLGALTVTHSLFTGNSGAPGYGNFGYGGGAIISRKPLIVSANTSKSPVTGNGGRAALDAPLGLGVANSLYVDHSTFISNSSEFEGGAIDAGAATIVASTFQSNTAAYGGAIDILSSGFTVSASTFIANALISTSVATAREGGAIDTNNSGITNINVINSTFFANLAPAGTQGGAINGDSNPYMITSSTFLSNTAVDSGSGGAFSGNSNFVLRDTLVAFNVGGNCVFTMTLSGANLEFPGTTCGGASVTTNPLAQAPANNGGPTLTSALLPASPAINAGDNSGCPGTDQRGAIRPVGPKCDIGAFEFGGLVPGLWLPVIQK